MFLYETNILFQKDLNETDISDLPDKEFKIVVIKILTEVWKTTCEQSETIYKYIENIRKFLTEITQLKNTEVKTLIEQLHRRLDQVEGKISKFVVKTVEFFQSEDHLLGAIWYPPLWDTDRS